MTLQKCVEFLPLLVKDLAKIKTYVHDTQLDTHDLLTRGNL